MPEQEPEQDVLDVAISGGGPAGLVAGLLFARAGLRVTVHEKHGDFLRDFRGDTVHASTLDLLDGLGLGPAFARLPHRDEDRLTMALDDGAFVLADFRRLPGAHQHIAMVPQWDLLDLLAAEAGRYPGFALRMNTEVTGLLEEPGGRVGGLLVRDRTGGDAQDRATDTRPVRARLTIAADGRDSVLRERSGLPARRSPVPIDVLWFALPTAEGDRETLTLRFSAGAMVVLIRRDVYWQCGFVIAKGAAAALLADDAAALRARFGAVEPGFADRLARLDAADVRVLDVRMERLRRWWRPGLLCIGDSAHAMSPVGGVGINLAVQDAVAAANLLAGPLRRGEDPDPMLARVQRRRALPATLTQAAQERVHARMLAPRLGPDAGGEPLRLPLPLRAIRAHPPLARVTGRLIAIGLRPERPSADLAAPPRPDA